MTERYIQTLTADELVIIKDTEEDKTYDFTSQHDIQKIADLLNETDKQANIIPLIDEWLKLNINGSQESYHQSKEKQTSTLRDYHLSRMNTLKETKAVLLDLWLRTIGE